MPIRQVDAQFVACPCDGMSERSEMLRRMITHGRSDESGMSVVEVVVAAFILFFVLTAVLGLIGATTKSSISAKQRTAMTNAISGYIEYARSLPFEQVALSSVEPSGAIEPTVTVTASGFTIVLTNTVSDGAHGLKELQVNAVCSAPNDPSFPTLRSSAFAAIRDRLQSANELGQPHSGGPVIEFGHLTPAENTVLYAANIDGGGAAYVDASVESTSGSIQNVEFRVGDQRLRDSDSSTAGEAYWTPGTATAYQSILWDTRQLRSTGTTPAVSDGWRIIRIMATDDLGRRTFKDRRFFIDNYAPADPGPPTGVPRTDVTSLVTWLKSMDGSDPASTYELGVWKEHTSDHSWSNVGIYTLDQPAHTLTTTTFGRYWVRVRALSPRGLSSNYVSCTGPFVARPLLTGTGTCVISGSGSSKAMAMTVSLSYPAPDFLVNSIQYDLYRGTSATALSLYQSNIAAGSFTETVNQSLTGSTKDPVAYYYQVRATYTPSGWPYTYVSRTSVSNIVGPTPTTDGTITFVPEWGQP